MLLDRTFTFMMQLAAMWPHNGGVEVGPESNFQVQNQKKEVVKEKVWHWNNDTFSLQHPTDGAAPMTEAHKEKEAD